MVKNFCTRWFVTLFLACPVLLTGCGDDTKAEVTLQLKEFGFERVEGLNRFTHNREFREHVGVGVTLNRGKVCVNMNKTCVEGMVSYRISAQSVFLQKGHHFATPLEKDVITIEYWGIDDNDNNVEIKMVLDIDGDKATIKKQ